MPRLLVQTFLDQHPVSELEAQLGIRANRPAAFPNLVMLKYSQIDSPMSDPTFLDT